MPFQSLHERGVVDLQERRELYNGFGNGLSRAFELALAPLIFGFLGHLLDGLLGTGIALTVVFALAFTIGGFIRMWYGYDAEMKLREADAVWNRAGRQVAS